MIVIDTFSYKEFYCHFMTIMQHSLCYSVRELEHMLEQCLSACMPWLAATDAFRLRNKMLEFSMMHHLHAIILHLYTLLLFLCRILFL